MPYCGNCGAPLGDTAVRTGVCPVCGARVTPQGDVIETVTSPRTAIGALTPKLTEMRSDPYDPAATRASEPPGVRDRDQTWATLKRPRVSAPIAVTQERSRWLAASVMVAGIIIALGVVVAALLLQPWLPVLAGGSGISGILGDHTTTAATATSTAQNSATATAWAIDPPNGAPTATSAPGAQPTATDPAPTATVGPTATPAPTATYGAILTVSKPTITCNSSLGVYPKATFTVSNTGSAGSSLTWTATASGALATVSPNSATQYAGSPTTTVSVHFLNLTHGTVNVTISAPGANPNSAYVTIPC